MNKNFSLSGNIKKASFLLTVLIVSITLGNFVSAWTEPSVVPPGCASGTPGCDAPINVSSNTQTKAGSLNMATDAGANVGIGTAIPNSKLEIVTEDAVSLDIAVTRYSNAQSPKFIGRRAQGTSAIPSAVQSGDSLAVFGGRGYGTTDFSSDTGAYMNIYASQDWTDSNQGSTIAFYNTPNNTASPVPRLVIFEGGTIEAINYDDSIDIGATQYSNTASAGAGANFAGRRARGTFDAKLSVQQNDYLATFTGRGYDGTTFSGARAAMSMSAAEDWTNAAQGAYMDFSTTPAGDTQSFVRMRINNDGNVGIGTTSPAYKLQLSTDSAGKPNGGTWANSSDVRLKTNIEPITGELALNKILQLQGVQFDWINPEDHGNMIGTQGGFIAQEVEKVFPKWISEINPSGKDVALVGEGEKIKSLSLPFEYDAYLVEAIKEQQKELDQLKTIVCGDRPEMTYCK